MNFEKAQNYLQSFVNYERFMKMNYNENDFDLHRFKAFLEDFSLDYGKLKYVHVAGSKGKGTVCSLFAQYLWKSGYKVGLYTSPHILSITERFWLNGANISESVFATAVAELKAFIDLRDNCELTYFELLTALAFKLFIDAGVDYVVLEVGLGGRLDATNVVIPELSIITKVEMEHVGILGNNLSEIMTEKLGIVKEGRPVLVAKQSEEGQHLVGSKLSGRSDVFFAKDSIDLQSADLAKKENGRLVFQALKLLLGEVDLEVFMDVFDDFQMMGRVDIRQIDGKNVVFDMAHTVSSMENLIKSIPGDDFVFLVSMLKGKDISGVLKIIEDVASKIVFTSCHKERGLTGEDLAVFADGDVEEDCVLAYNRLFSELKRDQVLVVTGSHFLIAKILSMLQ